MTTTTECPVCGSGEAKATERDIEFPPGKVVKAACYWCKTCDEVYLAPGEFQRVAALGAREEKRREWEDLGPLEFRTDHRWASLRLSYNGHVSLEALLHEHEKEGWRLTGEFVLGTLLGWAGPGRVQFKKRLWRFRPPDRGSVLVIQIDGNLFTFYGDLGNDEAARNLVTGRWVVLVPAREDMFEGEKS